VRSRLGRNWRGRFPAVRPQAYPVRAASFIRSSVTRAYTLWSFRKPLIQRLFCLFAARFCEAHSDPILFAATWARFAHARGLSLRVARWTARPTSEIEVALLERCGMRALMRSG